MPSLLASGLFIFEVGLALLALLVSIWLGRKATSGRMPPGPNPIPFLGNVGLPKDHRAAKRIAAELLEKRAAATWGRPHLVMANDLVGLKEDPVQTSDPILHKQYRRLFASAISPRAVQTYWSMQIRQARTMTLDVITSPLGYMQAVKRAVAAISFLVAYGYELKDDDEMLLEADRGLRIFEKLMTPGAWLVDVLPILQVIPSWFPGANFKRLAKAWGHFLEETRDTPFNWVKTDLAAGKAKPSFVAQLLQEQDDTHGRRFPETRIRWTAGVIYGAGSDTSVAAIHTFLAAMVQYPEVQMKAQAELDSVIGRERPPTIADRDSLPYCWAVVQETLRWQPVATLGLPHVLQNDEEFEGYFLPKGTTVLANVIYMSRDEHEYPSADEFKPERFLAEDGTSLRSESFGFGFGRRVCPGVHLAEATIFGAVISLLFTANISWPENAERTITYEKALGVNRPQYFPIDVNVRFPGADDIVRGSLIE